VLPDNFTRMMQQLRQIAEIVSHRVTLWNRDDAPPARPSTTGWMS